MRLFVAIDLPDEWRVLMAKPQESIGWLGKGVKWVDPKSTHLTLKFLGETPPNHFHFRERSSGTTLRSVYTSVFCSSLI